MATAALASAFRHQGQELSQIVFGTRRSQNKSRSERVRSRCDLDKEAPWRPEKYFPDQSTIFPKRQVI